LFALQILPEFSLLLIYALQGSEAKKVASHIMDLLIVMSHNFPHASETRMSLLQPAIPEILIKHNQTNQGNI